MNIKSDNFQLVEDRVSQFDDMVLGLAASLKQGYQETKDMYGKDAPSPVEYYKRVREKFFELLEKK
jgi:hypothetical protein